jgi:hypothetical protein
MPRSIYLIPVLLAGVVLGCSEGKTEKPKDGAPPIEKKAEVKDPAPKPVAPAFDSRDPQRTLRWLADIAKDNLASMDNELAMEESRKKLHAALASVEGKEVDWPIEVKRVTRERIELRPLGHPFSVEQFEQWVLEESFPEGAFPFFQLTVSDDTNGDNPKEGIATPQEQWVSKIRRGDRIRVKGIIHFLSWHSRPLVPPDGILFNAVAILKAVEARPEH